MVWCRERVSRTRMHWSMAVCLVTHNTGIAQSSPDPFLCDTCWSQFSALFMHRRKRKKKMWGTQTFCYSLWWKLIPSSLPFQIWRETLQKEWVGKFFLSLLSSSLLRLAASSSIQGSGAAGTLTQKPRIMDPAQKPLRTVNDKSMVGPPPPTQHIPQKKCGGKKESGGG